MKNRRKQRGFTFVETMLSVFIVGSAGTIVAASMPISTMSKTKASYASIAANYAQKQIEQMKVLEYGNLTATRLIAAGLIDSSNPVAANVTVPTVGSSTTYTMATTDSAFNGQIGSILPSGTANVTVTQDSSELRSIVITLTWVENRQTRTYSVGTLVANL